MIKRFGLEYVILSILSTMILFVLEQGTEVLAKSKPVQAQINIAKSPQHCIVLTQSETGLGPIQSIINKDVLRINLTASKTFLLSKAPSWRVSFYNPNNNKGMDLSFEEFMNHAGVWQVFGNIFAMAGKPPVHSAPVNPVFAFQKMPMNAEDKPVPPEYMNHNFAKFGLPLVQGGRIDPAHRYNTVIFVLQEEGKPSKSAEVMRHFLRVGSISSGILIKNTPQGEDKSANDAASINSMMSLMTSRSKLTTQKIDEKDFPASTFDYPVNFKKVPNEIDVVADSARKKNGEDVLQGLDLGTDPKVK